MVYLSVQRDRGEKGKEPETNHNTSELARNTSRAQLEFDGPFALVVSSRTVAVSRHKVHGKVTTHQHEY